MPEAFDRRVLAPPFLDFVRCCQRLVPCHLGGGAALSGAYLAHRLTGDIDLFCHDRENYLILRRSLAAVGKEAGVDVRLVRDAPTFARYVISAMGSEVELDLVEELVPDIEPQPSVVDGIAVESLADLRASKLTCLLSRSEPRDLVDLLFLDRAGYAPEADLPLALQKDAGMDPAVLAWLLGEFPCRPLPRMLKPLTEDEVRSFRDDLRERFRRLAVPRE